MEKAPKLVRCPKCAHDFVNMGGSYSRIDWVEAKALRDKYKTLTEIAVHFNTTLAAISRGFKRLGIK